MLVKTLRLLVQTTHILQVLLIFQYPLFLKFLCVLKANMWVKKRKKSVSVKSLKIIEEVYPLSRKVHSIMYFYSLRKRYIEPT